MNKVIAFYGAERGVGVSMLAQSAAELIAEEKKDLRVLLVNLQGRFGNSYTGYRGVCIEELREYLDAGVLDHGEVLAAGKYTQNFYIIGGLQTIGEERYYKPKMAAYLLSELSTEFDLILADAGGDPDSGLTLGAVESADKVIFVISQREAALRRAEKLRNLHKQLQLDFAFTLCSRYDDGDPYTGSYLCRRLELPRESLLCVADLGERAGRLAEAEGKTLLSYGDPQYAADILNLSNRVLMIAGYEPIVQKRKKRWKNFI